MAHGLKPYGRTAALSTVYGVQDMGELAVRLGSIDSFDRRGNVVFMDDFENGTLGKWLQDLLGAASGIALSTLYSRSGAFSVRLTAGVVANDYARIQHLAPYPVLSIVGSEGWFTIPTANNGYLTFGFYLFDGVNLNNYLVRYNPSTGNVDVLIAGFVWQNFAVGLASVGNGYFFGFKLVADLITGRYVRCIINEVEYNLSAFLPFSPLSAIPPRIVPMVSATDVAATLVVYADDIIITQNEP